MEPAVEFQHVTKTYGKVRAGLDGEVQINDGTHLTVGFSHMLKFNGWFHFLFRI
jgi:hypothetical protein